MGVGTDIGLGNGGKLKFVVSAVRKGIESGFSFGWEVGLHGLKVKFLSGVTQIELLFFTLDNVHHVHG